MRDYLVPSILTPTGRLNMNSSGREKWEIQRLSACTLTQFQIRTNGWIWKRPVLSFAPASVLSAALHLQSLFSSLCQMWDAAKGESVTALLQRSVDVFNLSTIDATNERQMSPTRYSSSDPNVQVSPLWRNGKFAISSKVFFHDLLLL